MSVALLDRIRSHIVVNFLVGYFGYKMTQAKNNSKLTTSIKTFITQMQTDKMSHVNI